MSTPIAFLIALCLLTVVGAASVGLCALAFPGSVGSAASTLKATVWHGLHPRLAGRYREVGLFLEDAAQAHRRGWTPETAAELKPYTGRFTLLTLPEAARELSPAAFACWRPHLPAGSDLGPVTGNAARHMQALWEAAGPLAPEAARAGLTVEETTQLAAEGGLTAGGLALLISMGEPTPAWPWSPLVDHDAEIATLQAEISALREQMVSFRSP